MRWLKSWFDETDWPRDPRLDVSRDAVWELSLDGRARGWLTTSVGIMRTFPFLNEKQEQMWSQVHWLDGDDGYLEEDYGPEWYAVEELLAGYFLTSEPGSFEDTKFTAIPITGSKRDRLWELLKHGSKG
ncbi:hypothetical protein [Glutamicibacter sp. PS]|uniref:hypothetical protein n=1 Tax=Glutamicibacter sp. PS TaxID=3075634 RepID=UPI00283F58FF|nr:hypothetical protein [Glutamicibacter sp. PS]MDR4532806.1 hypothetical protein [Glutamicibacter sp. PS]